MSSSSIFAMSAELIGDPDREGQPDANEKTTARNKTF